MSVREETIALFDMHQRLNKELIATRTALQDRGRFFISDPEYKKVAALCAAVSLAADLGALIAFDRTTV